jgi:hypothetical protein
MTETTISRLRAVVTAFAPVALLVAFLWHHYLAGRLPNESAVAEAVAAGPTRWGLAHLAAAVASGIVVLAFIAVRGYLRERDEDRWSALGLPFVVIGSVLYATLPGMEFVPLAAYEAGTDPAVAQEALAPWFLPVLLVSALTFTLGVLSFAAAIARRGMLSPGLTRLIVIAFIVLAASRFVPVFAVQSYAQVAAALIALWPLAGRMWTQSPAPIRKTPGTSAVPG